MDKYKRIIGTVIFNIAETILILLMGILLKLPINYILITYNFTKQLTLSDFWFIIYIEKGKTSNGYAKDF